MVAYRFCRPDDNPYLVRAVNKCYAPHFPEKPEFTLEDLQAEIREFNVWPSNCMVAGQAGEPIAVCIAAKRAKEVAIWKLAAHPDFVRQGHCSHILDSLKQKLAVLGPPRIVAEVPADNAAVCSLLESLGYRQEQEFHDWLLRPGSDGPADPPGFVARVTLDELEESGVDFEAGDLSWQRQNATLEKQRERIEGWAAFSPERVEAFLLCLDDPGRQTTEIARIWARDPIRQSRLLELLLRCTPASRTSPVSISRIHPGELPDTALQQLGFQKLRPWIRYATSVGSEG